MVNALLLMTIVIFVSVQSVMKKTYNEKVTGGAMSFSAASCVAALVVFLITSGGKLNFNSEFLIYSVLFAVSYSVTVVANLLSLEAGPLSGRAGKHQSVYRSRFAGGRADPHQSGGKRRKEDHSEMGPLCRAGLCGQRYVFHGAKGTAAESSRLVQK